MTKHLLAPIVASLVVSCTQPRDQTVESAILKLAPNTDERIFSISELPPKVKEAFIAYFNPYKDLNLDQLALRLPPSRIDLIKSELDEGSWIKYTIKDRPDKYFGGCTGNDIHFLEGGKSENVVWILYESGSIAGDVPHVLLYSIEKSDATLIRHCWIDGKGSIHDTYTDTAETNKSPN